MVELRRGPTGPPITAPKRFNNILPQFILPEFQTTSKIFESVSVDVSFSQFIATSPNSQFIDVLMMCQKAIFLIPQLPNSFMF
jgi:hypothetical protein